MQDGEAIIGVLRRAESILHECSSDYNHPNFTDRHGTGPRITAVLAQVTALLNAMLDERKELR